MILNRKNIMFSIPCYLGINGGTVSERVEICQISQYKSFDITISFNWVFRYILKSNPGTTGSSRMLKGEKKIQ